METTAEAVISEGGVMLLWEPPSDSLVHITNLLRPVCEPGHSARRNVATSVFIVLFLAVIVTANVPVSGFHKVARTVDDPVLAALGPRQVWNVFSPDPPTVVAEVFVRFRYKDGTRKTWRLPLRGALVGAYRDYRWRKLADNVARSDAAAVGLLVYAMRTGAGSKPLARADLVRSIRGIAPIGAGRTDRPPPQSAVVVSLRPAS